MKPEVVIADSKVTEDIGRYAVVRGPIVFCMEEKDNGKNLRGISLNTDATIKEETTDEFGLPVTVLQCEGYRTVPKQADQYISRLYQKFDGIEKKPQNIRLIPYRLWANRGEGEMSVFI